MNPSAPTVRIALIGDRSDTVVAHRAIPPALDLAGTAAGLAATGVWLHTADLRDAVRVLAGFDAVWVVPASPYASMEGALSAIRFAREAGRPFLGTCGGFQHAVIEIARDVCGATGADHAEMNPGAADPVVTPLACSLVEKTGTITFAPGSRLHAIFGGRPAIEGYHCRYGVAPAWRARLEAAGLRFTGFDEAGEPRAAELAWHPFFIGTLFQPERSALRGEGHPLITAFVRAAGERRSDAPKGQTVPSG
jgi:CTP synthase (UTP-ammonia lyase)